MALHFAPAAGRGERLADLSGPSPVLEGLSFTLDGQELPGDCEPLPLLAALWETGRLVLGEIRVKV